MSLLVAGASPGSTGVLSFEAPVDGESTGEGFGDLLAQLFAVTTEAQPAATGVIPTGMEAPTGTGEEGEQGSEELFALESLLTSPNSAAATVVAPPTEARAALVATVVASESEITVAVAGQPPNAEEMSEPAPAGPPGDAAAATEASSEFASMASSQQQALEAAHDREAPETAPRPESKEQKLTATESVADPSAESQQSVVRPVGNANASNGNNEGNPEKGRPQFANNVVAAAHNAPQTGGAAVAEAAQLAGANPEPQVMAPEQVVEAVIERAEAGGGEVNIRLDPPDLGEVMIRVTTDGDSVRVHIQAERPEAAQLLRNAAGALESLLSQRGLDLSDVFVGADERGSQQSFENQSQRREEPSATPFSAFFDAPPGAEVRQHNRIRSAYNPDGALLYRV